MPSDFEQLKEMGFPENRIKKAMIKTDNRGLQPALQWLLEHSEDADIDDPLPEVEGSKEGDGSSPRPAEETTEQNAKSLKCDECGKIFRTETAVHMHAAKSGHSKFSESTEEVKPLTEEEKKKQMELLQEKLREKRIKKETEEKERQREAEIRRRTEGKGMREMKEKFEEQERLREAEKSRRERAAEKEYRQQLKERIARERAEKAGHPLPPATSSPPQATATPAPVSAPAPAPNTSATSCRLQIRLTNGAQLQHNFCANEPLSAVRLFVELNRTDGNVPFILRTNFPVRVFTEDDMDTPLSALGLCPSAVIMLQKHGM